VKSRERKNRNAAERKTESAVGSASLCGLYGEVRLGSEISRLATKVSRVLPFGEQHWPMVSRRSFSNWDVKQATFAGKQRHPTATDRTQR
jgi:hypothetical protein